MGDDRLTGLEGDDGLMDTEVAPGEPTRWRVADPDPLPVPGTAFQCTPGQISKRRRHRGADLRAAMPGKAWARCGNGVDRWITQDHVAGHNGVIELFCTFLAGRVDPRVGTIRPLTIGGSLS